MKKGKWKVFMVLGIVLYVLLPTIAAILIIYFFPAFSAGDGFILGVALSVSSGSILIIFTVAQKRIESGTAKSNKLLKSLTPAQICLMISLALLPVSTLFRMTEITPLRRPGGILLLLCIVGLHVSLALAIFCRPQTRNQNNAESDQTASRIPEEDNQREHLMISQYAAFYVYQNSESHKNQYINKLISLGYNNKEAESLLNFECGILRKFNKQYLLQEDFTQNWLFGLDKPFFEHYPKEKEDILKEHFLTLSELCKIVDEAEWHYWNSHERQMTDEVWAEICAYRLNGQGAEFAIEYFEMTAMKTGIPEEKIGRFTSNEGNHLNVYKWG